MDDQRLAHALAIGLMRKALAIIDEHKGSAAGAQLQHAIDCALVEDPLGPEEHISPDEAVLMVAIPLEEPQGHRLEHQASGG